jgi:hypothetical protein
MAADINCADVSHNVRCVPEVHRLGIGLAAHGVAHAAMGVCTASAQHQQASAQVRPGLGQAVSVADMK